MHAQLPFRSSGRFQLLKHTGHTFDAEGKVVALGETLEATELADNYFTPTGSAFWASSGPTTVSLGVSTSAVPPGPGRIGATVRTSTTLVSSSTDRSLVPNAEGNVWWRRTFRFSFASAPGQPQVTLRQAQAILTGGPLVGGATSGVASAALLLGPAGGPTSVFVDMETESFDIVWEYTEYFPPEAQGTVRANIYDGSGNLLSFTDHTFTIRPANLNNTSDPDIGWVALATNQFPALVAASGDIRLGLGTIGFAGSEVTFSEVLTPTDITLPSPAVGSSEYYVAAKLSFDDTTSTDQIECGQFMLGHTEWQVSFDPPVPKQVRHQARFSLGLMTR